MQYKSQKYPHPVQGLYSPGLNTASFPKQCRKDNQLKQLFQGSFWKNRNFFKGVFIKENPKRQEAKKVSHFFDTRTLF